LQGVAGGGAEACMAHMQQSFVGKGGMCACEQEVQAGHSSEPKSSAQEPKSRAQEQSPRAEPKSPRAEPKSPRAEIKSPRAEPKSRAQEQSSRAELKSRAQEPKSPRAEPKSRAQEPKSRAQGQSASWPLLGPFWTQKCSIYNVFGWPEPCICTVYDRRFGQFPAKNAVYTPYIHGSGQLY